LKTSALAIAVAVLGVLMASCSSGSSSGSCADFSDQSSLSGTATLSSGPSSCPSSVPLNVMSTGDASAGAGACAPVVNGCTATVSCTVNESGLATMISATLTASGNSFAGEESVSLTVAGTMVTCKYNLSGTFN
jgi:hypothetical protein